MPTPANYGQEQEDHDSKGKYSPLYSRHPSLHECWIPVTLSPYHPHPGRFEPGLTTTVLPYGFGRDRSCCRCEWVTGGA